MSEAALSSPGAIMTAGFPPITISDGSIDDGYTITSIEPSLNPNAAPSAPSPQPLAELAAPLLIPQPRGGALLSGGKPGNKGGTGRPTNEIREMLRGFVSDHAVIIADIARGEPVHRTHVRITDLVEHVHCQKCGVPQLRPNDIDAALTEIAVVVSASPRDRIAALEYASRYGVGTIKEVSIDSVRERMGRTLDLIRERVAPEQYASIVQAIGPVWS
jgi:hypothetical protein